MVKRIRAITKPKLFKAVEATEFEIFITFLKRITRWNKVSNQFVYKKLLLYENLETNLGKQDCVDLGV